MKYMLRKGLPVSFVGALTCGLLAQFIWKMIYWPEPLLPVILEIAGILGMTAFVVYQILRSNHER